ncbi:MAG: 4-coumarate--CoA ligase [Bryobacteraceae bacterium]|nr:4-coumarate--CoA ligase [Bryobacteraceae bacterium]
MQDVDLRRVISSLIQSEIVSSKKEIGFVGPDETLRADSLEMLSLATRVAQMFHLHEAGVQEYLVSYRTLGEWVEVVQFALTKGTGRISFQTSGSTSNPVICPHHISTLEQEIGELKILFRQIKRIISLVPSHHIYGFLFTALLPAALEIPVVEGRRRALLEMLDSLEDGDLVIGSPFHWLQIDRTAPSFPPHVAGVSSGGPCNDEVRLSLERKGLRLTDVYGSSETAGIGYRQGVGIPFRLFSFWKHTGKDSLTRHLPDGGVAEYSIPDQLNWIDHQTFTVSGRRDGVVQVAGMNVSPELIAARIKAHPSVAECAVRLMRAEEGERLKLFVVWEPELNSPSDLTSHLEDWLRENFRSHERPCTIAVGTEIPRNPMGKLTDW